MRGRGREQSIGNPGRRPWRLKTGQYIDVRNVGGNKTDPANANVFLGLTYQRWLATVLQAIGVPRQEFERGGKQGYGEPFIGKGFAGKFVPGVIESASDVPFPLKA